MWGWKISLLLPQDRLIIEESLEKLPHAKSPMPQHLETCFRGTRESFLHEIDLWARDFNRPQIYWLNGLEGTGKTTIAVTLAEGRSRAKPPGAYFFCSRDPRDPDLGNPKLIFPTLATTLARKYPSFQSSLAQSVRSCPDVASMSLNEQMKNLIVEPFKGSAISTVILIDAFDQCGDSDTASAILSALESASSIPDVKFFITSRPEPHIKNEFLRLANSGRSTEFSLRESSEDIRKFLEEKLKEFADIREVPYGWPTGEELNSLCDKAAGVFTNAVAIIKFICRDYYEPRKRLEYFLESPEEAFLTSS